MDDNNCQVFQGNSYLSITETKQFYLPEKIIVFDLDETLGSFGDLYILWSGIKHLISDFDQFNNLADMYPECIRFGVLTILEYLYKKKQKKQCQKIFIYTNNQCSGDWVHKITQYLCLKVRSSFQTHEHLNYLPTEPLFDKLICAFRINNKSVEVLRSSHKKSMNDLINCTLLSREADICFVDDVEHEEMKNSRVYYICPRPYFHTLTAEDFVTRLVESPIVRSYRLKRPLVFSPKFWIPWFLNYKRSYSRPRNLKNNFHEDLLVSKQLMFHLREFMAWKRPPPKYDPVTKSKTQKELKKMKKSRRRTKRKFLVTQVRLQ